LFHDSELCCAAGGSGSEVVAGETEVGTGKFGLLPEANRE
jgi:hypothetical protein